MRGNEETGSWHWSQSVKQTSNAAAIDFGSESPPVTPWRRFGSKAWVHGMRARCGGCWKWISSPSCFEPPHGPHPSLRYGQPVGWLSRSARLDTLHHPHLRQMLDKRIRDGVISGLNRQVVESRSDGERRTQLPRRRRHTPGRGDKSTAEQHLPARSARRMV